MAAGVASTATPKSAQAHAAPSPAGPDIDAQNWFTVLSGDVRLPTAVRSLVTYCASHKTTCGPRTPIYADLTGDGYDEALIPILGTNGVKTAEVCYGVLGGKLRLLYAHYGPEADTTVKGKQLVLTQRMYKSTDQQNAPSGPDLVTVYRWSGSSMVVASRSGGGAGFTTWVPDDKVVV